MIVLIKRALHVEGSPATTGKISASASGVLLGGRASGMSGILGRGGRVGVGGGGIGGGAGTDKGGWGRLDRRNRIDKIGIPTWRRQIQASILP